MSKPAKAKLDQQLARDSQQLEEQTINKINAMMEVQVDGAETVTKTR
jgi:hypothetical protein